MLRTTCRLVLAAGVVAVGAAVAVATRADLMIAYGFSKAFQAGTDALPFEMAAVSPASSFAPDGAPARAEVGDEAYWQQRGGAMVRPAVKAYWYQSGDASAYPVTVATGPLYVGQQVDALSPENGSLLTLEVVAIDFVGAPAVNVSVSDAPAVRLMRVTYRVLNRYSADADADELVQLWLETEIKPNITPATDARSSQRT